VPGGRGQDQVCEAGAGKKRRVLIRSAADITQLQEGDRGVPTICNSPFVDEVIPPNIGVRYALGRIYRDGPDHCVPILEALGISAADFTVCTWGAAGEVVRLPAPSRRADPCMRDDY
jgi:hypothetical protein